MEGPSLFLAEERLRPFIGKKILRYRGNSKIGIDRLKGKKVLDIFSWGKHLVFQFDTFAFRFHFMMFGSYRATVDGKEVTGDYPTGKKETRLAMGFSNGHLETYNCSIKVIESANARAEYDFSGSVMSKKWDPAAAHKKLHKRESWGIADALLDQTIFAGVGNIIRNEVLWLQKVHPDTKVRNISAAKLKAIVGEVQPYSKNFYKWRKAFVLRKHYQVYQQSVCPRCGAKVKRSQTKLQMRRSFYCTKEQKLKS